MIFINFIHNVLFLIYLSLGVYIINKNKNTKINQSLFLLMFFFSLWSLGLTFIQNPFVDKDTANIFAHITSIAIVGYGIFTFISVCIYTGYIKINRFISVLLFLYFISLSGFQIVTNFGQVTVKDSFGLWIVDYNNKIALGIINLLHNSLVLISFVMLFVFLIRNKNSIKRKQVAIIVITGFISYILASLNVYIPQFTSIKMPLLVDFCMLIFAIGLIYSISKYDFLKVSSKQLLNDIIEILPTGLIIADEKNIINHVNQSVLKITNQAKRFYIGKDIINSIKSLTDIEKVHFNSDSYFSKQIKIDTNNNKQKTVILYYKTIVNRSQQIIGSFILIQDIELLTFTQKKLEKLNKSLEKQVKYRTKELIAAKEKAEESDQLKSAFLQNLSHEIRTPLNAICGFSQILVNNEYSKDTRNHYLEIIQEGSNKLLDVVSDILTIARIETKQEKIIKKSTNINFLINNLYEKYKNRAQIKNIRFTKRLFFEDQHAIIITDEDKLKKILNSLLSNAFKFTHKGTIHLGYKIVNNNEKEFIQFCIEDSGIGIDPQFHEKIFNRFTHANQSIQKSYGGTGLGLSIVLEYVNLLNGSILFHSGINKGTKFHIRLPYKNNTDEI